MLTTEKLERLQAVSERISAGLVARLQDIMPTDTHSEVAAIVGEVFDEFQNELQRSKQQLARLERTANDSI